MLKYYAAHTKLFLIYNQQFTGARTVRLLEQGREWYLRHVPHTPADTEEYSDLFEKANEPHPRYSDGRTYRDMHDVWQWGITDHDLTRVMSELGFHIVYEQDCGWLPKSKKSGTRLSCLRGRSPKVEQMPLMAAETMSDLRTAKEERKPKGRALL